MNRAEHLAWAKERALEYVERGELIQAVSSMLSDLKKYEGDNDFRTPGVRFAGEVITDRFLRHEADADTVRYWIEAFK